MNKLRGIKLAAFNAEQIEQRFSIVSFILTQSLCGDITDGHDDSGDAHTAVTGASSHPDKASLAPGRTPRVLNQPEVLH